LIYRIYFIKEGADPLTRLVMTSLILNALKAIGDFALEGLSADPLEELPETPLEELFALLNRPVKAVEIVKGFFAVRSSMCLIYLGEFGFELVTDGGYNNKGATLGGLALNFAAEVGNMDLVIYLGNLGIDVGFSVTACGLFCDSVCILVCPLYWPVLLLCGPSMYMQVFCLIIEISLVLMTWSFFVVSRGLWGCFGDCKGEWEY